MSKYKGSFSENERKLNIKKVILLFLTICAIFICFRFSVIQQLILKVKNTKIEQIEISVEKSNIEVGENLKINVKFFPENNRKIFDENDLIWKSSNKEVAEIKAGKLVGKSAGKTIIYVENDELKSNEIEIECLVNIKEVRIENPIETITLGNVYKLNITVLPENATYKELQFESSDINILNIDTDGNVIANAIGKSTIQIKDYKENLLKSFDIEVTKIPVDKIELDDTEVTLGKGQEYIINSKITPLEATFTDVNWESSDNNVVTIKNRRIKAIAEGTATIIASTDEGDKKAICSIKVEKNAPDNDKKFANGNYNIRTGGSTDYEILATTKRYEKIEFLQDSKNGWKKVRNSDGIVGYTLIKSNYYLDEKPTNTDNTFEISSDNIITSYHIKNVPYLNQISFGYPTGCEAVSAAMLLKYKGYDVSAQNIIDNTRNGSKKYKAENGLWYGANPFEEFVGHPSRGLSKGSYGVFAKPITEAMQVYAGSRVKNISGVSENELFNQVSKGNPVVVWCVKNGGNLTQGVTWNYEDGSGTFQELVGEHCAVLIGYDENYVYLNDPSAGKNVKQSRSKFISNWKTLFSQAIIVE